VGAAGAGEINQDDANDEGGLDAFTERDEKSGEQESSSCESVATTN
jgi:hypothetical protein